MKREYKKSTHTARFQKLSIMLSIRQNEENMQYPIRYYMYNKEWYHVQVILWTINTESSKRHGQNKSCETETPNVTFNIFFNATKKLQGLVTRIKHQIWRRLRNIWVKMMPPPILTIRRLIEIHCKHTYHLFYSEFHNKTVILLLIKV